MPTKSNDATPPEGAAGILAVLVFDAGFGAFEVADTVPGFDEGPLPVVLDTAGALLVVQCAMDWQGGDAEGPSRLAVAYSTARPMPNAVMYATGRLVTL